MSKYLKSKQFFFQMAICTIGLPVLFTTIVNAQIFYGCWDGWSLKMNGVYLCENDTDCEEYEAIGDACCDEAESGQPGNEECNAGIKEYMPTYEYEGGQCLTPCWDYAYPDVKVCRGGTNLGYFDYGTAYWDSIGGDSCQG